MLLAFGCLSSPILGPLQFLNIGFTLYMLPFCTLISLKISANEMIVISHIFQGIQEPNKIDRRLERFSKLPRHLAASLTI